MNQTDKKETRGAKPLFEGAEKLMTSTIQVKTSQHYDLVYLSNETRKSISELHREAIDLLINKYKTK